jgi:hypothetical protein
MPASPAPGQRHVSPTDYFESEFMIVFGIHFTCLLPNTLSLIESMDMREAQRSYEANLNVIEASKTMLMRTIDVLRG